MKLNMEPQWYSGTFKIMSPQILTPASTHPLELVAKAWRERHGAGPKQP